MTQATRAGLIKFALCTGSAASATTGIACTAKDGVKITMNDILIAVMEVQASDSVWTDVTDSSAIIAGNKIQCPESNTDMIAVLWLATDAGLQVSSPFVAAELGIGALANVAITISGIAVADVLIAAIEIDTTSGAWTDRTDKTTIDAANVVKCTESTDGNSLFVLYMDLTGPRAFSSLNLQFGIATIDSSPSSEPSTATLTGVNDEDVLLVALVVDEASYEALDELTSVSSVSADDTLIIDCPSPAGTAGAKIFCLYQKTLDLAS